MPPKERLDVVAAAYAQRRRRIVFAIGMLLALVVVAIFWYYLRPLPVDYANAKEHFKYGSIGSDSYDGIPLAVWRILPETFPEYLPHGGENYLRAIALRDQQQPPATPARLSLSKTRNPSNHIEGYSQFGFMFESGRELPVGFSQRRVYVDRVGLNCAVCHSSTVKVNSTDQAYKLYNDPDWKPVFIGKPEEYRVLVLGMPAHAMDLEAYFTFLFRCAEDGRFTSDILLAAIDRAAAAGRVPKLSLIESAIIKRSIGTLRSTLLTRRKQLHYLALLPHSAGDVVSPQFGPGRVDTFSPYKSIQFGFPLDGTFGVSDYPSIWNQRPREGMNLHWDGNNQSVFERNISASLGAGTTPVELDMNRMLRTAAWIGSPPPNRAAELKSGPELIPLKTEELKSPFPRHGEMKIPNYPFAVNSVLAAEGAKHYQEYCASCHGSNGDWSRALIDDPLDNA
ncbi:MAG: cytochrome c [Pirellulaceae bacterium]|nr:cytochrome c [Pirellulaceae bacterium]